MFKSIALSFVLIAPIAAQAPTDFSGTWVLDLTKSSSEGALPLPTAATHVITQVGDSISVNQRGTDQSGEMTLKRVFKVDGKTWANALEYQGTPMALSSVLSWNGKTLHIQTKSDFQGTPVEQSENWVLGADGKTLTQTTTTTVNGEVYATVMMAFTKK